MGECAILIDGGYLNKVLENEFAKVRIDIGRLGDELAGQMERLRTYYSRASGFAGGPAHSCARRAALNAVRFSCEPES
jgi:hypothetical protein